MGLLDLFRSKQLDRIESTLRRMETRMTQQEQNLNTALAAVQTSFATLGAIIQQAIDKMDAADVDLTDETAALTELATSLQSASDALGAAVNTPEPPPVEPPA